MVLNATYWIPHGDELIDLPNENSRVMAKKIAGSASMDNSDVRVVISPHGLALSRTHQTIIIYMATAEIPHENYKVFLWTKENMRNLKYVSRNI